MSKFCVVCGTELPAEANFCPECGESVGRAAESKKPAPGGKPSGERPASPAAPRRGRRPKADQQEGWLGPYRTWVLGSVAVTVVVLLFIGMQNRGSQSSAGMTPGMMQATTLQQQIEQAQRTLMQEPDNLGAITTLANAYFDAGSHALEQGDGATGVSFLDQAVAYYLRALERVPESPELRTDLGTAYNRLNRKEEAIAEFLKVLEHEPGFLTAMFNLGVVNEQLGNLDAAREWYGRVVAASPASTLGQTASRHLSGLGGGG